MRSTISGSGRRVLDLAREKEKRIEEQRSVRRELRRGRLSLDLFREGDRVRIQDSRTKKLCTKGTVTSAIFHEGSQKPSSYLVESDSGGSYLRNRTFLRMMSEQSSTPGSLETTNDCRKADDTAYSRVAQETSDVSPDLEVHKEQQIKRRLSLKRVQFTEHMRIIRTRTKTRVEHVQDPPCPPSSSPQSRRCG